VVCGFTCGEYACVLLCFAHKAAGAAQHPAFPAPSSLSRTWFMQDSGASAPRERGVMSLWSHCERSEAIQKSLREDILDCFVRFAPRNDERCLTSESEVAPQTGAADIEDIERCEFRLNPSAHRLAPTADTTSPVPPVGSPLPPATPTAVTAAHVAVRTDGRRFNCQSRLRCSRHDTRSDRCNSGKSNDSARHNTHQDVAATHCSHCVCSRV